MDFIQRSILVFGLVGILHTLMVPRFNNPVRAYQMNAYVAATGRGPGMSELGVWYPLLRPPGSTMPDHLDVLARHPSPDEPSRN